MIYLNDVLSHQKKEEPVINSSRIQSSKWVEDYVQKHKWLIPIDSKYLLDNFNFSGLKAFIENYNFV